MEQSNVLADVDLALVVGGDDSFGRCGPADKWKWAGNIYTPQCRAHDAAVRGAIAQGTSKPLAHLKALPLLPAAVGSYFRARFGR
jgi:hypothetical protein